MTVFYGENQTGFNDAFVNFEAQSLQNIVKNLLPSKSLNPGPCIHSLLYTFYFWAQVLL